ncbi:MAG: hypothetical protein M1819_000345 [Sarea resinae]|nr:MAG: hypothetical protein M1819_000345 [Sarea resinae]
MLNESMDEVVLVKGWKKGANWSFPRGKINKDEKDLDCAVREVYEETGFDVREAGLISDEIETKYIEITMREQHMRLYVFRGVPMDTHFEPRTRKEISKIEWYKLSELPTYKKNRQNQQREEELAGQHNRFYMVAPFLIPLKKWIAQQRKEDVRRGMYSEQSTVTAVAEDPLTENEATTANETHSTSGDLDRLLAVMRQSASRQVSSDLPEVSDTDKSTQEASAELKRLLSISKPQQQPDAPSIQPRTVDPDTAKSSALLALLRSSNDSSRVAPQGVPPPQTPFEQMNTAPSVPGSPHHHHARSPQFSSLPPPPSFPFPPSGQAHLQQQVWPAQYRQMAPQPHQAAVQARVSGPNMQPYAQQPLSHARLESQSISPTDPRAQRPMPSSTPSQPQHGPQSYQTSNPGYIHIPEFPNLHSPALPPTPRIPPPKLTTHSMALLNALKSGKSSDSAGRHAVAQSRSARSGPTTFPDETRKVEKSGPTPTATSNDSQHHANSNQTDATHENKVASPGQGLPATGASESKSSHQNSLLALFKSPSTSSPSLAKEPASGNDLSLPPVELPAMSSPGVGTRAAASPKPVASSRAVPKAVIPAVDQTDSPVSPLSAPHRQNSAPLSRPPSVPQYRILSRNKEERQSVNGTPTERFTPGNQNSSRISILQRPSKATKPDGTEKLGALQNEGSKVAGPEKTEKTKPAEVQILRRPSQPSQNLSFDRRSSQTGERKQALLSLFGKSTVASPPPEASATISPLTPLSEKAPQVDAFQELPRSKLGSFTSTPSRHSPALSQSGSRPQTPNTPAENRLFLLGYLEGVAKSARR